ncbi:OmpW family outer membrane protein [Chryseobacterium koreense]|uniref:Membrane protein n=1 Tax=Chryseobacterium koreense CCUG 49689 TaxID=1304281 RepID=A0A0J7LUZ4_9FLAO|nr:OmpW family outer membrane protein [Chryseobacterium koreense]KMQ72720.1 membrane protein [Chryseobacterium koreense CCUG 49689]MBB5333127.1 outer membrane protein [Chryseobacterium koreense]
MKKLFLVGALALFASMNAQMEKGSWIVSGKTGVGFNSATSKYSANGQSIDGPKVTSFSITPGVGYFVINNLAVGVDLSYTSTKTTFKDSSIGINYEDKQSMFAILPNATYYFATANKLKPYLGAGIGYGSATSIDFYNDQETTKGGLLWGAKGGMVYLLNSNVGLDLGVAYNSFTTNETVESTKVKTTIDTFGVNAGVSLFFK